MAFHAETVPEILAAVIKEEPDWFKLPAATPMRVRVLLHRCLQKDAKQRLRDIGDASHLMRISSALQKLPEQRTLRQPHFFGSGVSFTHVSSARIFSIEE